MRAKHFAAILFFALFFTVATASAQYGYTVQAPTPAGMAVGGTQSASPSYASAGPSTDPSMGMASAGYGGPAYTGQENSSPSQSMSTSLLSYGQLEVDYLHTTYKDKTINPSDGASISLMAKLFDPFFLHFGVDLGSGSSKAFLSQSYNFSTVHLGGGGFIALSDRVHLTGEVGMVYAHLDTTSNSVGFSEGAVYVMPGIRFAATDALELDGHLTATSSDRYDSFIFDVGGYYKVFSQMDVGLDVGFGDQSKIYKAGVRFRW